MIPIVYSISSDYEYAMITMISIISVLRSKKSREYKIYILIDDDFKEEIMEKMKNIARKSQGKDILIEFIRIGKTFNKVDSHIKHIKKATYYRLLIPELIMEDKCIYLDSDTIICEDLGTLFDFDIEDYYLAGVKAPWYHIEAEPIQYADQAKLPDLTNYINAGVLLMNCTLMREKGIVERFMELLPLNMLSQDQDIINSVCYGKIRYLPFRYNTMVKYASWNLEKYEQLFRSEQLIESWNNPAVIHYADPIKPWNDVKCVMGNYWWNVCRSSCLWSYFLRRSEDSFYLNGVLNNNTKQNTYLAKCQEDIFDFRFCDRLIVFGAGRRASAVIKYLETNNKRPEFIVVSDKRNNPNEFHNISVKSIDDIKRDQSEFTLLIATRENTHLEILKLIKKIYFRQVILLTDSWDLEDECDSNEK